MNCKHSWVIRRYNRTNNHIMYYWTGGRIAGAIGEELSELIVAVQIGGA